MSKQNEKLSIEDKSYDHEMHEREYQQQGNPDQIGQRFEADLMNQQLSNEQQSCNTDDRNQKPQNRRSSQHNQENQQIEIQERLKSFSIASEDQKIKKEGNSEKDEANSSELEEEGSEDEKEKKIVEKVKKNEKQAQCGSESETHKKSNNGVNTKLEGEEIVFIRKKSELSQKRKSSNQNQYQISGFKSNIQVESNIKNLQEDKQTQLINSPQSPLLLSQDKDKLIISSFLNPNQSLRVQSPRFKKSISIIDIPVSTVQTKSNELLKQSQESSNLIKNPYDQLTLEDLKVVEETIKKNRIDLDNELSEIQAKKNIQRQITLQPQVARKWEKIRNQLIAFTVMRKVFSDIKKYGTSMQALSISESVIDRCKDLLEKRQIKNQPRNWLFYPDNPWLTLWMVIMTIVYFLTAIISPYRIFFKIHDMEEESLYSFGLYYDNTMRVFFIMDMLVHINTVKIANDGSLIENRKVIIKNYSKRSIIFSILQIIPFSVLSLFYPSLDSYYIRPGNYDEVLRIIRVPYLISTLTLDQKIFDYFKIQSRVQRLFRFSLAVAFTLHIIGCLWTFIAKIQIGDTPTWIDTIKIDIEDDSRVYLFAIYWCLQTLATVGYGDVHASNDTEVMFTIVWMVMGAGVYSFTVGQLAKMFTDSESRSQKLSNSIYIMDEFCEQTHLPNAIKQKVRKALEYSSAKTILNSLEKEDFFDSIPTKLKTGLAQSMFKGTIATVPFLKTKDSVFLANLLPMLHPLKLNKGDFVYKKDQYPNLVYFIIEGRVNFLVGKHDTTFKSFLSGSYFGEVEIFHQCLRLFSVRCQENCEFLTLDRDYLGELMDKFPNIENEMFDMVEKRRSMINESLNHIHMLLPLSESDTFWKSKESMSISQIIIERRRASSQIPSLLISENKNNEKVTSHKVNSNKIKNRVIVRKMTKADNQTTRNQAITPSDSNSQAISTMQYNLNHKFDSNFPTQFSNQVVLNVFDENKQPMLVEVYNEEIKQQCSSESLESNNNQLHPVANIENKNGEGKIAKLQQKYGMGSLDCIEERSSRVDLENNSHSCAISDNRHQSPPLIKKPFQWPLNPSPNQLQVTEIKQLPRRKSAIFNSEILLSRRNSHKDSNVQTSKTIFLSKDTIKNQQEKISIFKQNSENNSLDQINLPQSETQLKKNKMCSIEQDLQLQSQEQQLRKTQESKQPFLNNRQLQQTEIQKQQDEKEVENSQDKSLCLPLNQSPNSSLPQIQASLDLPQKENDKDISKSSNLSNKISMNIESLSSFQEIAMIDSSPEMKPQPFDKNSNIFPHENNQFKRQNKFHKTMINPTSSSEIYGFSNFHSQKSSWEFNNINLLNRQSTLESKDNSQFKLKGYINPFEQKEDLKSETNQRRTIERKNNLKKGFTEIPRYYDLNQVEGSIVPTLREKSFTVEKKSSSQDKVIHDQNSSSLMSSQRERNQKNIQEQSLQIMKEGGSLSQIKYEQSRSTIKKDSFYKNESQTDSENVIYFQKKNNSDSSPLNQSNCANNSQNNEDNNNFKQKKQNIKGFNDGISQNSLNTNEMIANKKINFSRIEDELYDQDIVSHQRYDQQANPLLQQISNNMVKLSSIQASLSSDDDIQSNDQESQKNPLAIIRRQRKMTKRLSYRSGFFEDRFKLLKKIESMQTNQNNDLQTSILQKNITPTNLNSQSFSQTISRQNSELQKQKILKNQEESNDYYESSPSIKHSFKLTNRGLTGNVLTPSYKENNHVLSPFSHDNQIVVSNEKMIDISQFDSNNLIKNKKINRQNTQYSLSNQTKDKLKKNVNNLQVEDANIPQSLTYIPQEHNQKTHLLSSSNNLLLSPLNKHGPIKSSMPPLNLLESKEQQNSRPTREVDKNFRQKGNKPRSRAKEPKSRREKVDGAKISSRDSQKIVERVNSKNDNNSSRSSLSVQIESQDSQLKGNRNIKSGQNTDNSNLSLDSTYGEIENMVIHLSSKLDDLIGQFQKVIEVVATLSQEIDKIKASLNSNKYAKSFTFTTSNSQQPVIFLPPSIPSIVTYSKPLISKTETEDLEQILSVLEPRSVVSSMKLRLKQHKRQESKYNIKDALQKLQGNDSDESI